MMFNVCEDGDNRKILYGFLFTLLCIIIYIIYRYGKINSDNESIDDKE